MFVSVLLASVLSASQATGSIAGCIVDAMRKPLPGVTVAATGESFRYTTETNTAGCYSLKGVNPGAYRVTARLLGFTNVTRDKVTVTSDAATTVDMTMIVTPMCDCVLVDGTLQDLIKASDAVLHLRITGPAGRQSIPSVYYPHAASVLHAVKSTHEGLETITLLQNQSSGAANPYDVDQEMVVFLQTARDGFSIINSDPGLTGKVALVFLVRDGAIVDAPSKFSSSVGKSVDSFLYELRQAGNGR